MWDVQSREMDIEKQSESGKFYKPHKIYFYLNST